jgi:flagellar biosynthesis protein FlhG
MEVLVSTELRQATAPQVWAIASGKGGVGKSVIATNLAISLANEKRSCTLIDADLGGANLHTLFGLQRPKRGLTELFTDNQVDLQQLAVPTGIAGLDLISGAGDLLDIANLHHAKKQKLIRQAASLNNEHIIIDIGAGSSFNSLDFFLMGHQSILVVVPTPSSLENVYHFLKAALSRKLTQATRRLGLSLSTDSSATLPWQLIEKLRVTQPQAADILQEEIDQLQPRIIVNQARTAEERQLGGQIASACRHFFNINVEVLGTIDYDEHVYASVQKMKPVLREEEESGFARAIHGISRNLLAFGRSK